MKKVLVIGKNSYIGKEFKKYADQNAKNELTVDLVSASDGEWERTSFEGYDVIIHLAGIAHMKGKNEDYTRVNKELPIEVADKAVHDRVNQFVFISTLFVYGDKVEKITVDTKENPNTPYGISKFQAELVLQGNLKSKCVLTIVRPPMVYGEGCKGNYPRLVKLARMLPVFPEYHNKRSMIHCDNLCKVIVDAIVNEKRGIICPQDMDYKDTCQLVKDIRRNMGKNTFTTKAFNPIIRILSRRVGVFRKMFGDCYYEK